LDQDVKREVLMLTNPIEKGLLRGEGGKGVSSGGDMGVVGGTDKERLKVWGLEMRERERRGFWGVKERKVGGERGRQ
jgi:hypothetical protein